MPKESDSISGEEGNGQAGEKIVKKLLTKDSSSGEFWNRSITTTLFTTMMCLLPFV
jgi:hypothetical protein